MPDKSGKRLFNIGSLEVILVKPSWPSKRDIIKNLILAAVFCCAVDGCKYILSDYQKPKESYSESYQNSQRP